MKKVLLYSGGMDSWIIRRLYRPDACVYVDMKTRYSSRERMRLPADVQVVDFPLGQWERPDAIIPLRNLFLCMVACNLYQDDDLDICLGATAGDRVLDKSHEFCEKASDLLSFLWRRQHWTAGRNIRVNIDYKQMTKTQLLARYIAEGGDMEQAWRESFSCYNPVYTADGMGTPCGRCKPCFRKFVSFAINGRQFTDEEIEKTCSYIMEEIYPDIQRGVYGRADEEREIKKVLEKYGYIPKTEIYAVDFDDTLTAASPFPVTGKIDEAMAERIRELRRNGARVVLYTSRNGYFLDEAKRICRDAGLEFDEVVGGKPAADHYIDRSAMTPEQFTKGGRQ